jgi:hypothetical protein
MRYRNLQSHVVTVNRTMPLTKDKPPQWLNASTNATKLKHIFEPHGPWRHHLSDLMHERAGLLLLEHADHLPAVNAWVSDKQQNDLTTDKPSHRHIAPADAPSGHSIPQAAARSTHPGDHLAEAARRVFGRQCEHADRPGALDYPPHHPGPPTTHQRSATPPTTAWRTSPGPPVVASAPPGCANLLTPSESRRQMRFAQFFELIDDYRLHDLGLGERRAGQPRRSLHSFVWTTAFCP